MRYCVALVALIVLAVFVTPGGASISEDDAKLELATAARFGTVSRGSLDGWKSAVAAAAVFASGLAG